MTPHKRFLLGGGGALMPVLVSFLAIDIGAALDNEANLSTGNIIGFAIRYIILFIVGGVVAYLHEDEHKSFKLFELGIAAPALITSLITAQGVVDSANQSKSLNTSFNISIISSAHAEATEDTSNEIIVVWNLRDVIDGATGKAYRKISKPIERPPRKVIKMPAKVVDKVKIIKVDPKMPVDSKRQEEGLLKKQAEVARAYAIAEVENAKSAQLKAELARAKADVLEKEYQAALAQAKAKATEAQALAAEQEMKLLEQRGK